MRNRKLRSQFFSPRTSSIHDSPYGKARFLVGRQVRIFDDSARADDGDRECSFRESWSGCNTGNGVYSFASEIKFRK